MSQQNTHTYICTHRVGDKREGRARRTTFLHALLAFQLLLCYGARREIRDSAGSKNQLRLCSSPKCYVLRCSVSTLFLRGTTYIVLLMIRDQRLDLPFDPRADL